MSDREEHVTGLLARAASGDPDANDDLFAKLYPALRKLARSQLNAHRRGTLCTTELVNEASLRLLNVERLGQLENRNHLVATAARAMRQILVDHARKKNSQKRGGEWQRIDLEESELSARHLPEQVLALEEALQQLKELDERCHQVVELKFFGGCSIDEIADFLGVSDSTVKLAWRKSRAFLYAEMDRDD